MKAAAIVQQKPELTGEELPAVPLACCSEETGLQAEVHIQFLRKV